MGWGQDRATSSKAKQTAKAKAAKAKPAARKRRESKKNARWELHSAKLRDKLGISKQYAPWTTKAGIKLRGFPNNARERDILDCAWTERLRKTGARGSAEEEMARAGFFADFSQSVEGKPWGEIPSLCGGMSFNRHEGYG